MSENEGATLGVGGSSTAVNINSHREYKKVDSLDVYLKWLIKNGAFLVPLPSSLKEGVEPNAPIIKWRDLKVKPTWEDIEQWKKKTNRFGIVCGEKSDWIVGIDIDNYETFIGMGLGPLTGKTWTEHRDFKKFHILVKSTKPIKKRTLRVEGQQGEDVSIRADGQIIACGYCPHAKGGQYKRYMKAPIQILTVETGFFDDFVAIWNDFRGNESKGGKSFSRIKGFKLRGNLLDIVNMCIKEDGKELKEFVDNGDTCQFRCPFPGHDDLKPSFVLYKHTNSFFCFGCQKGGTAINFVAEYYKISKKEAAKRLRDTGHIKERGEKSTKDFDLLAEVESALEYAKTLKYHGAINFDPEIGLFYTVPVDLKNANPTTPLACTQPVLYLPREGFAHQIEQENNERDKKGMIAQEDGINRVFAEFSKAIEGVPLYIPDNQRVQILQYYLSLLKNGYFVCKYEREVLEKHLVSKHEGYFKLDNDVEHYIIACWAVGTYLFPMFPVFPYLIHVGEKGTNKSGELLFLAHICWNSTLKLSLPNEAPLFRMMQNAKPTQLIDEVHRQLNDPIRGPLLKALFEAGHELGGCVPRCDPNDNNKICFYDVYCPKSLASREELELEEKAITIIHRKNLDKKYAIARKNLGNDRELDVIQCELLKFSLERWADVFDAYNTIEPTPKLSGRYFLLWAPLLAICKVVYPSKYEEMMEYAEKAILNIEKQTYEVEIQLLSWLFVNLPRIKNNSNSVFLKELTEELNVNWQKISSALRNLGLIKNNANTPKGKRYYLHIDRIKKLAEERNITIEETEICDLCGKEAFLTGYEGQRICDDCLEKLDKEEPKFFEGFSEEQEGPEP